MMMTVEAGARGHSVQRDKICGTIGGSHGENACRGHMAGTGILRNVKAAQDQRMASPAGWAEKRSTGGMINVWRGEAGGRGR